MDEKAYEIPDDPADLAERIRETERFLSATNRLETRQKRLDQLRQMLAVFGLMVGASEPPPISPSQAPTDARIRMHETNTTADPELAALLGLALAVLDTLTDHGGDGLVPAYEELVRELINAPSVAERELKWWQCMHNRALVTYGLVRLAPPPDLAPRSEAVVAADALVWAAARTLHGATAVRLMLETPPDEMHGGAAGRRAAVKKGIAVAQAGAERLNDMLRVVEARGDLFD